jgi:hypothetical protein
MLTKTFILDSETKLQIIDGKYHLMVSHRPVAEGDRALQATQFWITDFGVRYPGYASKMQGHFDAFIGK